MNLLFDLCATQPIDSVKRHGGGKYAEIIFMRMIERKINFSCYYSSKLYLNPVILKLAKSNKIPLYDIDQYTIDEILSLSNSTRVYSAIPTAIAMQSQCEVYGTIHDLRFLECPYDSIYFSYCSESFLNRLKFYIKSKLQSLSTKKIAQSYRSNYFDTKMKIITVSEHSKYEMLSYFPELQSKNIKVFYSPNTSSVVPANKRDSGRYFLSVSGHVWLKNILRSIQAFDNLISAGLIKNIKYKITGARASDFKYRIKNPNSFDFYGYVEEDELEMLYANAYCFVFPSLSEGFGYPPLEAMRYKVPVISSPISSMAQILDSGALYFNPFSVEEIMNRMLMMMDYSCHNTYSERGYCQYLKIKERQDKDLDLLIDYILQ
jgi:glycosyltransferase involved in cell wall biosynthesis